MNKDFDRWSELKKHLNSREGTAYAHPREVWWCALGMNIGAEADGKHDNFERPVIVMRVYNKETLFVLPTTSKEKVDKFHYKIVTEEKTVWVKLTQGRVISNKRLLRKVDILSEKIFAELKERFEEFV